MKYRKKLIVYTMIMFKFLEVTWIYLIPLLFANEECFQFRTNNVALVTKNSNYWIFNLNPDYPTRVIDEYNYICAFGFSFLKLHKFRFALYRYKTTTNKSVFNFILIQCQFGLEKCMGSCFILFVISFKSTELFNYKT